VTVRRLASVFMTAAVLACAAPAVAQRADPAVLAEQREALSALDWMNGEWRGTAEIMTAPGQYRTIRHTERIGPMLDGTIKVIEGHSYEADGSTAFNAFAILSWDRENNRYVMRSYAAGRAGDFPLETTSTGWTWSTPSQGGEVRYTTVHTDGGWTETGYFIAPGREPMRVITLSLTRSGDSDWPVAGAVAPGD
jgi:hypothetical protein